MDVPPSERASSNLLDEAAPETYATFRGVATRFLVYVGSFAAIILVIAWPIYARYESGLRATAIEAEQRSLDNVEEFVHNQLLDIVRELRLLSTVSGVRPYLANPTEPEGVELQRLLAQIALGLRHYGQMRVLDLDGQERIRVNYRDGSLRIVPRSELQNKSDSYYVQATLDQYVDEIYVSDLDLNVERGDIEIPYVPTMRFAKLVPGYAGEPIGMFMVDYKGEFLLAEIEERLGVNASYDHLIANQDGYFLLAPDGHTPWGSMVERPDATLANAYPQVGAAIEAASDGTTRGSVQLQDGVALFRIVNPFVPERSEVRGARTLDELNIASNSAERIRWTFVSILPDEVMLASSPLRRPLGWFTAILVASLIVIASYATASARAERRAFQRVREQNQHEIEDLYENAPVGYHTTDADGRIQRINRTELDLLGYERGEVVGRMTLTDLVAPESREAAEAFLNDVKSGTPAQDVQLVMRRKDGSTVPVALSSSMRTSDAGAVAVARTSAVDISERRRLETELTRQANTDALTNLMNRRRFFEIASVALARAGGPDTSMSLLQIDIDHFKSINDRFGHKVGDEALKAFTVACAHELRERDIFARIGGEEFVILLPGAGRATALQVAERVRSAVEQASLVLERAGRVNLTCSIGIAEATIEDRDVESLMQRADERLYEAKEAGRNCVRG